MLFKIRSLNSHRKNFFILKNLIETKGMNVKIEKQSFLKEKSGTTKKFFQK